MPLTKTERAALADGDFAVPSKRKLPIPDVKHLRMGWDMVGRTEGLTHEEIIDAKRRILARADELGMDTSDWVKIKAMSIAAMALDMPVVADHPNRMPFSGVLTKIGEPSTEPPHGSDGKRVLLTRAAAETALPSLLGMAVDLTADFDGHDPQAKIGIITSADIEGDDLCIAGFLYASDFPNETARIRAEKDDLGFSFEATNVFVADPGADPLEIVGCVFTGAAILLKAKAAYQTTSLRAALAKEIIEMTNEEMKALLDGALKPLADQNAAITARLEKIESASAAQLEKLEASKQVMDKVEPHATELENCAASMEKAGIGCAAEKGHVAALRKMAKSMRASAALGKVPDVYRDHDWPVYAGAEKAPVLDEATLAAAVDKAVAPMKAASDKAATDLKAAQDKLAASETKLKDAEAKALAASKDPGRKTLSPAVTTLLAKAGLAAPEGDSKLEVTKVDEALSKAGLTMSQRIQAKTALSHAQIL